MGMLIDVFDASSHQVEKNSKPSRSKNLNFLVTYLIGMIKHEITDQNTLEILQTVYDIYITCDVAKNYSDVVSTAINEARRKETVSIQHLIMCFMKNVNTNLTFPVMLRWKKRAQFLLIHDEFYPLEFSYNEWKKNVKIQDYIDVKLLTAPVRKIENAPEKKTIIVDEKERATILYFKEKFNFETVDETITYLLQQTNAWKLVNFISRLLNGNVTLEELSIMNYFGAFILALGERRESDNIQVVSEFYPYVYDLDFINLINEVEVDVRSK